MASLAVSIGKRFCGPDKSGNGGYSAGLFARALVGTTPPADVAAAVAAGRGVAAPEITLRKPPPLERPLQIENGDLGRDGVAKVTAGDQLIAEVRWAAIERAWPAGAAAPSFAEAERWAEHFIGRDHHSYPHCFVCGTARAPGDGLRIFPGRPAGEPLVAAPWIPDASLASAGGALPPEMLWAALDCTGYFAVAEPRAPFALLGRMAAVIEGTVEIGEPCVVVGTGLGGEGRKRFASTSLFGRDGRLVAWSRQVWITIA